MMFTVTVSLFCGCGPTGDDLIYGDTAILGIVAMGEGTVTRSPQGEYYDQNSTTYTDGDTVTLTAVPRDGHVFDSWRDADGNYLSDQQTMTVTVRSGANIYGVWFF